MQANTSERNLPLALLGYGAGNLMHKAGNFLFVSLFPIPIPSPSNLIEHINKAGNFIHKLLSECGKCNFEQLRQEVVGYTADGGVDWGICDASFAHSGTNGPAFDEWRQLIEDISQSNLSAFIASYKIRII